MGNFPTTLGGTSVYKLAYLWFVSPTQINLQAPADSATGTAVARRDHRFGIVDFHVAPRSLWAAHSACFRRVATQPARHPTPSGSGAYGGGAYDLAGPVGFFSFATRPVNAGEILVLYGVRIRTFGPRGYARTGTGAAPTTNTVSVTSELPPKPVLEAGLYQLNADLLVPQVSSGDLHLVGTVAGVSTPPNVLITVYSEHTLRAARLAPRAAAIEGRRRRCAALRCSDELSTLRASSRRVSWRRPAKMGCWPPRRFVPRGGRWRVVRR